jgi:diguanylate cyclase (GGDEF)-like protein
VTHIHRFTIVKIYLVVGLSLLLLTGSFYFFGLKPLSDRLHDERAFQIDHVLTSKQWLLEAVINRHHGLAQQSASRTAIRNQQIAYQRGEISREALIAFSQPKLADAVMANAHVLGISRFDLTGTLLYGVGLPLPEGIAKQCELERIDAITMLGPVRVGNVRRLFYCSPIVDQAAGLVGADILTMDDNAVREIIDNALGYDPDVIVVGIVGKGGILYWPGTKDNLMTRAVLEKYLKAGTIGNGYLVGSRATGIGGWKLYAVTDEGQFFAEIDRQRLLLAGIIIGIAVLLFVLTVAILRPVIRTLLREEHLIEMSQRDGLTGLYNHAFMKQLLEQELSRARRYKRPLTILMFDIDHFKQVNDTYGHVAGDDVLKHLANVVRKNLRAVDFAARYGGEEFLLILPETGKEEAAVIAERIRAEVAAMHVVTKAGDITVTVSLGMVNCDLGVGDIDSRGIAQMVDEAMYTSKKGGRNRITVVSHCGANMASQINLTAKSERFDDAPQSGA